MDFNLYLVLVFWDDLALWLMQFAAVIVRTNVLVAISLILIAKYIGMRSKAVRLWLQQEGY